VDDLLQQLDARFGLTPSDGVQILTPRAVLGRPFDPGIALVVVPEAGGGAPVTALPGRAAHAASAATLLRSLYPSGHAVHRLDGREATSVGTVTDEQLAAGTHVLLALEPLANLSSPYALPWLVARLRQPDGCPWDREQTHQSLAKFLLEESYEVYDALEAGSTPELAEELGDLLLQVILHAQYAAEDGVFDMSDVHREVMTKIVRRHPHVFGDTVADTAADVTRNWEQIKAGERASRAAATGESETRDGAMPAAFAGLSRSLPALAYAQEMQERAASLGYDWPSVEGVLDKVREEAQEIATARDDGHRREEFGDLMMVLVNLGRKLGIDAEGAVRAASAKFAARFAHVERLAAERAVELRDLSLDQLDDLWEEAKVAAK
jgi:tetrapyrrole methylase family protein/MazG family protein